MPARRVRVRTRTRTEHRHTHTSGARTYFDHELLDVYHAARRFNQQISELVSALPRGQGDSRDNLKRASLSITRNIAEGSGKWRLRDKVNFYHIARGSATEAAASLDELVDFGVVQPDQVRAPKETLGRVVAMLISMIRALESREGPDMSSPRQ